MRSLCEPMAKLKFTDKQQAFINEYLKCWNATEAARRAGYSERSAQQIGSENLLKPVISFEIRRRIDEQTMSADEALLRLSNQARATFGDVVKLQGGLPFIDWEKAVAIGAIDNIKEITFKEGSVTVKLHDSQAALVHILRQLQLKSGEPTERVEHTHEERANRITEIFDTARDRRARRATDD